MSLVHVGIARNSTDLYTTSDSLDNQQICISVCDTDESIIDPSKNITLHIQLTQRNDENCKLTIIIIIIVQ